MLDVAQNPLRRCEGRARDAFSDGDQAPPPAKTGSHKREVLQSVAEDRLKGYEAMPRPSCNSRWGGTARA